MQTHGYERSDAWRQALALLDHVGMLTNTFDNDPFGFAGKIRGLAADLPRLAATTYEQMDYLSANAQAQAAAQHLFQLDTQARVCTHLKLLTPKQLTGLHKRTHKLAAAITALPDALFEDDGLDGTAGPNMLYEAA